MDKRSFCVAAFLIVALAGSAQAQRRPSTDAWAALSQLTPGAEIRVIVADGRVLRGYAQKVTTDSLAINATTSQETLPRGEIRRVQLKRAGHRGRNTLVGLAIGAGGGLAIGAALDTKSSGNWFPNVGKAFFTPVGAIIGTVVGVAMPTGGWREIYRAP